MKKKLFNLFTVLLLSALSFSLNAQVEKSKKIEKEYPVSKGSNLEVETQFSQVELINWDKNTINAVVEVKVSSDKTDLANKLLEEIMVEIKTDGNDVYIETSIPDRIPGKKETTFEISISVNLPKYINLDMESTYGSVYIEELEGQSDIEISYGALQAISLSNNNSESQNMIECEHSSCNIGNLSDAQVEMRFSKAAIEDVRSISIDSEYSSVKIENAGSVNSDSRYDTYSIMSVKDYFGESSFGNLHIAKVTGSLTSELEFSRIKVNQINKGFQNVKVSIENGAGKLNIDPQASFIIRAYAESGNLGIGKEIEITKQKRDNADHYIEGKYGNENPGKIDIGVENGAISVGIN